MSSIVYDDDFLVDSLSPEELGRIESITIKELSSVIPDNIDSDIKNQLIKYRVYQKLATMQLEGEGMSEKLSAYEKLFNSTLQLIRTGTTNPNTSLGNATIVRG